MFDVISFRHSDVVLLRHNYIIHFFDVVTFFDNVRITLYFGTFELRMEISLPLRFVLARHRDIFFITLQLRYLFVCCSYFFDNVRIKLYFSMFELHTENTP